MLFAPRNVYLLLLSTSPPPDVGLLPPMNLSKDFEFILFYIVVEITLRVLNTLNAHFNIELHP
jgi:hypothetical protein